MGTAHHDIESPPRERAREDSEDSFNLLDSDTEDEPKLAPKPEPTNVLKLSNEVCQVSTSSETGGRPPKIKKRAHDGDVNQNLATYNIVSTTDGSVVRFVCGCCEKGHQRTTNMPSGGFAKKGQRAKRKSNKARADDSINQLREMIPKVHFKSDLPPEGTHRIQRTTAVAESTMVWVGEMELAISFLQVQLAEELYGRRKEIEALNETVVQQARDIEELVNVNATTAEEAAANAELLNQVRALLATDRR